MLSINTVAYRAVVLGGLTLFAIGHPKADAALPPAAPGLTVAAAAPAVGPQPGPAPAAPAVQAAAALPPAALSTAPPASAAPALAAPALAAPALASAVASVSGNGFTLASLSVELPASDRDFPSGPGVEVAQANCAACHSVGMVLNQPALSRGTWETEVHKMIAVYKAPVSEEDAKTIVGYLDSIKGAK